jgi:PTH1 family peptidyl-tRNA hydrolase
MVALIIGLGNPGGEYANTRHNVGWMCLAELERRGRFRRERREGQARVREGSIDGYDIVLARPQTFMNLSGRAALPLLRRFGVPVEDLIVVHDDIDLAFGRLRLKRGGGSGGNNGVRSLVASLQSPEFMRVRIGMGRPPEGVEAIDHVLSTFPPDQRERLPAILKRAADAAMSLMRDGLEPSMTEFNRAPDG